MFEDHLAWLLPDFVLELQPELCVVGDAIALVDREVDLDGLGDPQVAQSGGAALGVMHHESSRSHPLV
jgi:hypothetical protein